MRLADSVSRLRLIAKRLGWAYALLWLFASVGRHFRLHVFIVSIHPTDHKRTFASVNAASPDAHLLTRDEVVHFFNHDEGYGYSRAFAAEALSRGDRCVGVFEHGRLVWYCWYAREAAPVFDDVEAVTDWPFLYAYNAFTESAQRGRGLFEIGVHASARIFASEGFRGFTAYVEAHNPPPLITSRRMGDPVIGFVFLYRGARGVRWAATPGCRQAGFRIRRK